MKTKLLAIVLCISALPLYGQGKRHNADIYFEKGAEYLVMPGEKSDSMAKVAITWYSRSIKADRTFWFSYRNRARLYSCWHHYNEAVTDLTSALKYCPLSERFYLYTQRADIYYATGTYDEAIKNYTLAIPAGSNLPYLYLNKAKCYWKLGQKANACRDYQQALKLDPGVAKQKEFLNCQ